MNLLRNPSHQNTRRASAHEVRVDYERIQDNWSTISRMTRHGTSVAGVLKCDAYGFGVSEVAKTLYRRGCQTFFVSSVEEAAMVRKEVPDPNVRVIALYPDLSVLNVSNVLRSYSITPCLASLADARMVLDFDLTSDLVVLVDTGMSQQGIPAQDAPALSRMLANRRTSKLLVLSHLANSENRSAIENRQQLSSFLSICAELQPDERSLAASAGIMLGSDYHFDLIRTGDALFGINPLASFPAPTRPVLSLTGRIESIRTVPEGKAIGYGGDCTLARDTRRIAMVRVGYADGYPRLTRGHRHAIVNGRALRIAGQISMEFTCIDVTDVQQSLISVGTDVELIGDYITLNHIAESAGTVATEIALRILLSPSNIRK